MRVFVCENLALYGAYTRWDNVSESTWKFTEWAKMAVLDFVKTTTDKSGSNFVPPENRIAEFAQDGTLWVEHPLYTQVVYCFDHVATLVKESPN